MPDTIPPNDRERLQAAYAEAIDTQVMPAYRRLRDFVRDEHLPQTRETHGMRDLPGG